MAKRGKKDNSKLREMIRVSEKWTQPVPGWALILGDLMVYFGDRMQQKH